MRYRWEVNRELRNTTRPNRRGSGSDFPMLDLWKVFFYTFKHKWGLYFNGFRILYSLKPTMPYE